MKHRLILMLLFCSLFLFTGCAKDKNFVGTWEADLFEQGNAKEQASDLAKGAYGDFLGSFASIIGNELHWNATMTINEDGTLTMDNGMQFTASWQQEGDKIIISGDSIAGTATLSDDQKTLYFHNTVSDGESEQINGFVLGSSSIDFEFNRKE